MSIELVMPDALSGEAEAYAFLEQLRWGDEGPQQCPHCGSDKGAWFLQPKNPEGRKSKGGSTARSQRRVWKCRESQCRRQFSVLTNTVMHGTKMAVQAWVEVIYALCSEEQGLSARDIAKRWGVAEKSAFTMLTRIQQALERPEVAGASLAGNAPLWVRVQGAPMPTAAQRAAAAASTESVMPEPEPAIPSRIVEPLVAGDERAVAKEPAVVERAAVAPAADEPKQVKDDDAEARAAAQVKADVARALAEALGETALAPATEPQPAVSAPAVSARPTTTSTPEAAAPPKKQAQESSGSGSKSSAKQAQESSRKPTSKKHRRAKKRARAEKLRPAEKARDSEGDAKERATPAEPVVMAEDSLGPSWASTDAPAHSTSPDQLDLFSTEADNT